MKLKKKDLFFVYFAGTKMEQKDPTGSAIFLFSDYIGDVKQRYRNIRILFNEYPFDIDFFDSTLHHLVHTRLYGSSFGGIYHSRRRYVNKTRKSYENAVQNIWAEEAKPLLSTLFPRDVGGIIISLLCCLHK